MKDVRIVTAVALLFPILALASVPLDPASVFAPNLVASASPPVGAADKGLTLRLDEPQVQLGAVNPAPAVLDLPINYSAYVDLHQANGKWKVGSVIGAIGADVWVQPLSAQWSVSQSGWTGGTIDGGAAVGTGFGVYYQSAKGSFSFLKVGCSAGVDSVSGQKAGLYAGLTVLGTIKI